MVQKAHLTAAGFLGFVIALALAAGPAQAQQDAAALVDSLYGKDIKRVQGTADKNDDLTLAKQMLESARTAGSDKATVVALCQRAMDLSEVFPPGHETALAAADLAMQQGGETKPKFQARAIALLQKRYTLSRGDERIRVRMQLFTMLTEAAEAAPPEEAIAYYRQALNITPATTPQAKAIQAKLKTLQERDRLLKQVKQLQAELAQQDEPEKRTQLVLLLLLDMDSPAQAGKQLTPNCDEMLRTYVPMAGQDGSKLAPTACLELAEWFRSIVEKAQTEGGKATAANRAWNYYQQFLDRADKQDPQATKAKLAMGLAEGVLKAQGAAPSKLWASAADAPPDSPPAGKSETPAAAADDGKLPSALAGGTMAGLVFLWSPQTRAVLYPDLEGKVAQGVSMQPRGKVDDKAARFQNGALIAEEQVSRKLLDACRKTNRLTLAVALWADGAKAEGPARIVSFSRDGHNRDFTLGQNREDLIFRLRTTATGANGSNPELTIGKVQPGQWMHVTVTYLPGRLAVYINGTRTFESDKVTGDFSNWELMALVLGDEWRDARPWQGRLTNLRIYNRVIADAEIKVLASPVRGAGAEAGPKKADE